MNNLRLQPDKCEFLRKEDLFRACNKNETSVKPDPKKVEAVKNFSRPRNAKAIKQFFLDLAKYYRRFLCNFSKTARLLTALLKKDELFVWKKPQKTAFTEFIDIYIEINSVPKPLLQHPDFTQNFTDASGYVSLAKGLLGKINP